MATIVFRMFTMVASFSILGFGFSGSAIAAPAQASSNSVQLSAADIARIDPTKLRGICNDVYGKIEDNSKPDEWSYAYERDIYMAANVNLDQDNDNLARAKIRYFWSHFQQFLKCDRGDFDVTNGIILKYAFNVRKYGFVDNAIKTWNFDLNIVDESDGLTVFDYVEIKRRNSSGTPLAVVYEQYIGILIRYGAKRCRELPNTSRCK